MVMLVVGLRVLDVEVDMAEDSELVVLSYLELMDMLEEVDGTASAVEDAMLELDDIDCIGEVMAEELAIELGCMDCTGEVLAKELALDIGGFTGMVGAEELGMVGITGVLAGGTYCVWLAGRVVEEDGVMV